MSNRKGSQREQDKDYGKCGRCGKVVDKKDDGIECELCACDMAPCRMCRHE